MCIYRRGNWGLEKWGNLVKIIKLFKGKARIPWPSYFNSQFHLPALCFFQSQGLYQKWSISWRSSDLWSLLCTGGLWFSLLCQQPWWFQGGTGKEEGYILWSPCKMTKEVPGHLLLLVSPRAGHPGLWRRHTKHFTKGPVHLRKAKSHKVRMKRSYTFI